MVTIKECTKCKFRLVYSMFGKDEDVCEFCKPKEDKDGKT